ITGIIVLVMLGVGLFVFIVSRNNATPPPKLSETIVVQDAGPKHKVIGMSVEGRDIEAYIYGNGATHLLFVGGIHGGYEWNSVLLAYKFMDYLAANPGIIPKNLTISIIPSANPDGVFKVVGKAGRFAVSDAPDDKQILAAGRFNAHDVDLNRNFDCKWKPKSTWQSKIVSAGSSAFSEPETKAIRDFVLNYKPNAVIFWHSQANAVFASECKNGILSETLDIMNAYSRAAGYPAVKSFDAYEITGDAEGWLASINIPAITVELKTHETIEWEKNLAGINALLKYYADK
ncbi:MAG: M14 family metallopeptidase, partial [Candidatus Buchananbacteria bacterium]|nr:M14 family metallopeptidase [Candidatus Buchananbacteria bacterium]